ncbi:MAG: hypothetical protein PHW69_07430 [Elusimicrobiaceae bacterium]|nr:hypothetical protein [Elusimicrobiaceae bacterium]
MEMLYQLSYPSINQSVMRGLRRRGDGIPRKFLERAMGIEPT